MAAIELVRGDITKLKVDAIVNAANTSLLGGGGVDGAIHRAAGSELLAECKILNGCRTGEAKATKGYKLPARYVIHTAGPIWRGGNNNEENMLVSSYKKSLELAENLKLKSKAFPNISTGIYGFPKEKAAQIAVSEVRIFLQRTKNIEKAIFVCFDEENYELYQKLLNEKK